MHGTKCKIFGKQISEKKTVFWLFSPKKQKYRKLGKSHVKMVSFFVRRSVRWGPQNFFFTFVVTIPECVHWSSLPWGGGGRIPIVSVGQNQKTPFLKRDSLADT